MKRDTQGCRFCSRLFNCLPALSYVNRIGFGGRRVCFDGVYCVRSTCHKIVCKTLLAFDLGSHLFPKSFRVYRKITRVSARPLLSLLKLARVFEITRNHVPSCVVETVAMLFFSYSLVVAHGCVRGCFQARALIFAR